MGLSLRTKLAGGFGVILLIFVVAGLAAVRNMREQRDTLDAVRLRDMPAIRLLSDASLDMPRVSTVATWSGLMRWADCRPEAMHLKDANISDPAAEAAGPDMFDGLRTWRARSARRDVLLCLVMGLACLALYLLPTGFENRLPDNAVRCRATVVAVDNERVHQYGIVRMICKMRCQSTVFSSRRRDQWRTIS